MKQALPARRQVRARVVARRRLLVVVVGLAILAAIVRALTSHADAHARIAREVTEALQRNDLAAVERYQNAETATHIDHARVGRAADALAPLGAIKSVRQTAADTSARVYDYDLTFAHGTLHETIKFDPQDKIVAFHYDPPVRT